MTRWIPSWITLLVLAALWPCACTQTDKTPTQTKATQRDPERPNTTPTPKPGAKTAPGKTVNVCQKIIIEYQAIVTAGRGHSCKADGECVCYQGGYGDCGGVIDKVSNKKLLTLMHLARLSKCSYDRACAAKSCIPACVGGRCVHSARAER